MQIRHRLLPKGTSSDESRAGGFAALGRRAFFAAAPMLLIFTTSVASGASTTFSDEAAFSAAVPDGVEVIDFEALSNGTPLSGTTQTTAGAGAGIVLPPPVPDVLDGTGPPLELRVVKNTGDNPASSGSNTLGVEDAGNFNAIAAGTVLELSITEPTIAIGLTLITPEEPGSALFDGDAVLMVPGQPPAPLVLADGQLLGTFGGREYRAYFVGLTTTTTFTTASLDFGGGTPSSGFFFNLDDILVPTPEPTRGLSLLAGSMLLAGLGHNRTSRRRNRHAHETRGN